MKTCRVCRRRRDESHFRPQVTKGLRHECRDCEHERDKKQRDRIAADPVLRALRLEYQRAWRLKNLERVREYQREYHRAYRKRTL